MKPSQPLVLLLAGSATAAIIPRDAKLLASVSTTTVTDTSRPPLWSWRTTSATTSSTTHTHHYHHSSDDSPSSMLVIVEPSTTTYWVMTTMPVTPTTTPSSTSTPPPPPPTTSPTSPAASTVTWCIPESEWSRYGITPSSTTSAASSTATVTVIGNSTTVAVDTGHVIGDFEPTLTGFEGFSTAAAAVPGTTGSEWEDEEFGEMEMTWLEGREREKKGR